VPHHDGVEPRPSGVYFTRRHELTSQGDIFEDVPLVVHAASLDATTLVTSGDAMVLTASCNVARLPELLIAPVIPLASLGLSPGRATEIEALDCDHKLMFLPAEGEQPERAVRLDKAQLIDRMVLEACDKQSQLTEDANRQLMRKLVLLLTGNHFPRETFDLAADDF
jgi:hypothetical protein